MLSARSKPNSKRPRFFCENCGAEVPPDAKSCPACGRFFASVRCPNCGFTGGEGLFRGGCPVCGYSAAPGKTFPLPGRAEPRPGAGALPPWVYITSIIALIVVAAMLVFRYLSAV